MERSNPQKLIHPAANAAKGAVENAELSIEPDPITRPAIEKHWRELLASTEEQNRLVNELTRAAGPWWYVRWENNRLIAQRQLVPPTGAAFGMPVSKGPSLGSPQVTCNGDSILSDEEPQEGAIADDLAYLIAKIAKFLNWTKVIVHGTSQFERRFRHYALHETDFYSWTDEMARSLRRRHAANVDWEGIAEELEDLGRSEEGALKSHLQVLLAHLLKWAYQASHRGKSWKRTIGNSRDEVQEILDANPGLRRKIDLLFAKAYRNARRDAAAETTLDEDAFPTISPWDFAQATTDDFWPEKNQASQLKQS
jgi:Domain of unknown function DUF29